MPFKHFIQKIEGRLPEYTSANKPKFPYCFSGLDYDHQLIEFINGEHDRYDTDEIVTTHQAFLWRETPQGHDFWEEYCECTFDELPLYVQDIIYGWVEEFDLGEEVEFELVQEDSGVSSEAVVWVDESWGSADTRIIDALERLSEPLAVTIRRG